MQKQEKKDKEKKSSSQPLIAGLSFYLNQYSKKPSNSSTAKHTEDAKPKENSNKTEGAAISESTKKKNKDKPKKLDQKGEEDGQSKNKDFGKNKKPQKPHFWWTQYDTASHTKLFVTPEKPWYEQYSSFVKRFSNSQEKTDEFKGAEVSDQEYSIIKKSMESAYNQEVKVYQEELAKLGMATDQKWLNSVISSGTWSDKIAALTLRIQESPYHNLENLDILVGIAEKKDLRVSFLALEAIKDLLVHNLLPDNDHLYFLDHYRPIITSSAMKMDTGIILWFEDQLKQRMLKVINLLDNALKANILHFRKQSLDVLSGLLLKKPEQEHKILILIINKLGDADGTITTKTMDIIKQLIYEHPAMKLIIIKELKNFIYQPNLKIISIYHAVVLLLKIPVTFKDSADVPLQLVDCYISLFDKALQAKKDGSRLLSGLLQGINKTFHLLTDVSPLTKYLDVLFRLVHTAPSFAASIQALVLISYMALSSIEQKKSKKDGKADTTTDGNDSLTQVQDRYYTALYAKLQSEQVMESGKNTLFLNLLYRSLKLDPNELRIAAFFKRILMMTSYIAAELTAGFLFIISEVVNYRPQLKAILKLPDKNNTTGKSKQRKQSKKDKNNDDDEEENEGDSYGVFDNFDANKRNPAFACLNDSYPILSEQTLLTRHYHPSVQAFAVSLFNDPSHQIVYKGEDPLVDFSLVAFLNRFAYKNPKQKVIDELKSQQKKVREEEQPIHQEYELWKKNHPGEQLDLSTIAPEKQFYYKYFEDRDRLRAEGIIKPSRKDKGEEDDDEDDEVDEDEIDAFANELAEDMMKQDAKSRGEDLGDDDYDDDDAEGGFDDFGDFDDNDDDIDLDNDEDFGDFEDDEDDEEEEEIPVKKGKKKEEKSKKRKHGEDEIDFSSSALDFQDFVNEQKNKSKDKKDKKGKRKNDDDDDYPEPEIYHDEFDEMDDDEDDLALMMEEESKNSKKKNQSKKKNNKKRGHDDDDDEMDVDAGDDAFADADLYEDQMEDNVQQYTFGKKPSAGKTESQGNSQKDKKNFHKSRNNNNNRRNNKNHHHRRN